MEQKDEFTDWLKDKILSNQEEPAADAWNQIAESLDLEETWEGIGEELELEEVWQKVDSRLHRYGFLQLFERIGYAISSLAAIVLLFGLWWGGGSGTEMADQPLAIANEAQTEVAVHVKQQDEIPAAKTGTRPRAATQNSTSSSLATEEADTRTKPVRPEAAEQRRESLSPLVEEKAARRKEAAGLRAGMPAKFGEIQEQLEPSFTGDKGEAATNSPSSVTRKTFIHFSAEAPAWPEIGDEERLAEGENVPESRTNVFARSQFPAMEAGLGSAAKLSWLVNNKTLHAMEKTSLVTAVPAVYTDIFLTYGIRLNSSYMLQADGYLLDWSGQRYQEYRNGSYGAVEDKLLYRSLGLSLKKAGRQLSFSSMPMFSQLNVGLYGGLLRNAREYSLEGITDTRNEYGRFHFGLQAGYGHDLYLLDNLLLNYGVRGRLDLVNIYSGTAVVPGSLRRTRNASLDFVFSLKYILKK